MARLSSKVCLVTGAAAGIGRETVHRFISEDATVIAVDIDQKGLDELGGQEPSVATQLVDVTKSDQVDRLVAGLQRVDVLFNCAGRVAVGAVLDCSHEDWRASLDLNVSSIFYLMKSILPKMVEQGGGSIINMASVISSIGGAPERFAYGATKAAVIGMTKSVAVDYADTGVRCNAICPSAVETLSMRERIDAMADPDAAQEMFNARQPVGRMGTPLEIALLATYLASDESRFTTGSAIVIDGGAKL